MTLRGKSRAGFTVIELMMVVVIIGVLAAVAIPAVSGWIRKSKTAEARTNVGRMFDAASAYWGGKRNDRFAKQIVVSGTAGVAAPHKCPHPEGQETGGFAGITPPLTVNCNQGPSGKCVPGGTGTGYYDMTFWNRNHVWNQLQFLQEEVHYFHYNFISFNTTAGYGTCLFTAQAFGDLDDDGIFSTYERTGGADMNGFRSGFGMYIHNDVE